MKPYMKSINLGDLQFKRSASSSFHCDSRFLTLDAQDKCEDDNQDTDSVALTQDLADRLELPYPVWLFKICEKVKGLFWYFLFVYFS